MSSRKFLLPLTGLLVIGLAIAGWTARPAEAGISALTPSTLTPSVGVPMTIVAAFDANTALGSQNALAASAGIFSTGTVAPSADAVGGAGTSTLVFTANSAGARSLTATYTCAAAGTVQFTASQSNATPASTVVSCTGQAAATGLTVNPPTAGLQTQVQVSGTCAAGGQTLIASGGGSFGTVPPPQNGQINTPTSVVCTAPGPIVAYFYCNTVGTVIFTLVSSQGTLTCTGGSATGAAIVATPPSVGVGQQATISGNCPGGQTVTSSGGGIFQSVITGAQYSTQNSIICGGGVFSATFVCGNAPVQITFTSGTQTGTLGCGVAATGGLSLNPPTAGTTTIVSGQCAVPGQQLTAAGTGIFVGAQINGAPVPNVAGQTVVNCTSVGTLAAQFNCNTVGTVSFNLAGITGTFNCTAGGAGSCLPPAILNPATGQCIGGGGGAAASVSITANPAALQCTGSASVAFMSVSVKDALGQNVQDGTNVTITADSGTFAPSQATTLGGNTQFIYSPASTSSGAVNIRANAGAAQGTTAVSVTCGATSVPPPSSVPVTSPPPPPSGPVTIQPPNTGDAGLVLPGKDLDDNNWRLYAAATILVATGAGALALVGTKA